MKFVCDNCGTQYLISDEKIGPKGAKVRCKRCGNIIVIRPPQSEDAAREDAGPTEDTSRDGLPLGMGEGDQDRDELGEAFDQLLKGGLDDGEDEHEDDEEGPATEIFSMEELERLRSQKEERDKIDEVFSQAEGTDVRPSRGAEEEEDREEWYVAIKEEQIGPMGLAEVENRWESGEIGPNTLAWHPGMDDWVAIQDVPKLRYLLGSMESRQVPESVEAGASAPAPAQEEEWAPSSGSSLSSLVEQEIEAVKDSQPPVSDEGEGEMELPDEPEGGALAPWEKEEPVSGEVARPSESFFDSSLDQQVTDSGGAVVRAGRGLARPAYLSEGPRGGLNKKLVLIGSIALVVLIVVGVVVFKLLQAPPEEQVGKMAPIEKPAGADEKAPGKATRDEKAATPDKKGEGQEKAADKQDKPEGEDEKKADEKKKDVMVVGKPDKKPGVRTPPEKDKKTHAKKKKKKKRVAKAETKPVERRPPKEEKAEPPPSSGGSSNTLSKAQIATTMKKYIRAMKGCVKQQQQRDPSVTGTMLVSFVINGNGKVSLIKILSTEHKGTYVAGCITYIIKSMKFPQFSGPPITIPRVPLRLGG